MSDKDLDAGEQQLPKLPKRYARSMGVTRDPHAVHERYADCARSRAKDGFAGMTTPVIVMPASLSSSLLRMDRRPLAVAHQTAMHIL